MASTFVKFLIGGVIAAGIGQAIGSLTPVSSPPAATQAKPNNDRKQAVTGSDQTAAKEKEEAEKIASGEYCLSGWDGSFPALKNAVKASLRNPGSFDHVDTVRSPVDSQGNFGLIMTYRAENGFGGTTVESVGVEVDAKNCGFKRVGADALAQRLHSKS